MGLQKWLDVEGGRLVRDMRVVGGGAVWEGWRVGPATQRRLWLGTLPVAPSVATAPLMLNAARYTVDPAYHDLRTSESKLVDSGRSECRGRLCLAAGATPHFPART